MRRALVLMAASALLLTGCDKIPIPQFPPSTTAPSTTAPSTTTASPTTTVAPTSSTTPTTTTRPPTSTTQPPSSTTPPPAVLTAAQRFGWGAPLAGSDEFNYLGAPDPTRWAVYDSPGHAGNGRRTPSNALVTEGYLRLTGEADGDSAGMASKTGLMYGRWEVRARSSHTSAAGANTYHPVLIAWPDSNQWPEGAEYDFLENGAPGQQCAEAFLHYPNHQPKRQEFAQRCGVDLTQWHNFALEWAPGRLVGFIDGVEWFRFTANGIANAPGPMHLTIQLDAFAPNSLRPAVFDVDWARIYRVS